MFNQILLPKEKRNKFNLSHDLKFSMQMGRMVPTLCQEVVAGDTFMMSNDSMFRMAPMLAPIMHKIDITHDYFFVPNRIIWKDWEDFIFDNDNTIAAPMLNWKSNNNPTKQLKYGSVADYCGLPLGAEGTDICALPFAAYGKIFNEYYRDQNLVDPVVDEYTKDNHDAILALALGDPLKAAWKHDYFTSCLPFAQATTQVAIPLGDVRLKPDWKGDNLRPFFVTPSENSPLDGNAAFKRQDNNNGILINDENGRSTTAVYNPGSTLDVTPSPIDDLRRAVKLQEWLEKKARGGSRPAEMLLSFFGVKIQDARLDRPEFVGRVNQNLQISEVLSTAETTNDGEINPVGNFAGHGISANSTGTMKYYCPEAGFMFCITTIRPRTAYDQGIPRMFTRKTHLDYLWPQFAHIGEQAVLNKEIYYDAQDSEKGEETFGYIPRYSEYRYQPSRTAGLMKLKNNTLDPNADNGSLDFWHMARHFDSTPSLNEDFISCDPTTRIFAVTEKDEHNIYAHMFHKISVIRKLPLFGIPKL